MPGSTRTFDTMSHSYETADEFPIYKDKAILVEGTRKESIPQNRMPPSPADSDPLEDSPMFTPSLKKDEKCLTRNMDRGAPGDKRIFSPVKTPQQEELSRRRSQFYDDAFAYRESNYSARERVSRESMVMADVRTNVIIQDEYTFITDLSYFLSGRYQRSESSIIVTITHSACLFFSGSFDPAYTISITALPSQLQPTTNKRNTALVQLHLEESLGVRSERGLVRFIPVPEDNLATNGRTVTGAIEDLERENDPSTVRRSLSRGTAGGTKPKKRHSTRSMRNVKIGSPLPTHTEQVTPPRLTPSRSGEETPPLPAVPAVPAAPTGKSVMDQRAEKAHKMPRRKSFIASMFGRG